jgi:hypothetical protein
MDHNLRDVLMPLAILGSFGASLVYFTRTITDYILKKKMIEKGLVNEEAQAIFKVHKANTDNRFSSLKWGLIIFSAGVSLIIMDMLDIKPHSTLPYGLFAVGVSLGFLVYYFLMRKEINK